MLWGMSDTANPAVTRFRPGRWVLRLCLAALVAAGGYYVWVRVLHTNFHPVVPGQVYRSAQPSPGQVVAWAKEHNLRTVVNLRGDGEEFYPAERAAADRAGIQLVTVRLQAGRVPSATALRRLIEVLEGAPRPLLLHCRDGADRAGVASVLAAMAVGKQPYQQARAQLSARYLHVGGAGAAISGLLDQYEVHCRRSELGTGGWEQFRDWALRVYHRDYYFVEIVVPPQLHARSGQPVRVPIEIVNRSQRVLPAGDLQRTFAIVAFTGATGEAGPENELGPRLRLPLADVPPGGWVRLEYTFPAPAAAGTCDVRFDLVEERTAWFATEGSPTPVMTLTVE